MADRRVVVTGVGLVSPLGIGTEETWAGLREGRSGAGPITLFDASQHTTHFACEVKGFDPLKWVEKKEVKKMDRFIQFAVAAADFAVKDAALDIQAANADAVLLSQELRQRPAQPEQCIMGSHKPIAINDQIDFVAGQLPPGYLSALAFWRAFLQHWPSFPKEI